MFASYNASGNERGLIWIETDIRRGIPLMDIVGLPGSAIKEARDRIRAAASTSGIEFPKGHILINLAPAGIPKTRACLDLALALAILAPPGGHFRSNILVMGELTLAGKVRPVEGVLPALMEARAQGMRACILPAGNLEEARALPMERTILVADLRGALEAVYSLLAEGDGESQGESPDESLTDRGETKSTIESSEVKGEPRLVTMAATGAEPGAGPLLDPLMWLESGRGDKRGECPPVRFSMDLLADQPRLLLGVLAAAAGAHHLLVYGPPGCGKTMGTEFLEALMPGLEKDEFLEVNRMYSLAGLLVKEGRLLSCGPVRRPHHSSSAESLLGSRSGLPGEISLAHRGFLVLDESPEFRRGLLQSLREPMDEGEIRLGRVDHHVRLPAGFSLVMTMNACPCGALGGKKGTCVCAPAEVQRYWGRIGAPVLDRVDIRIPVGGKTDQSFVIGFTGKPGGERDGESRPRYAEVRLRHSGLVGETLERLGKTDLEGLKARVHEARSRQYARHKAAGLGSILRNGDLRGTQAQAMEDTLYLENGDTGGMTVLAGEWKAKSNLRNWHGLLRLARTFADLEGHDGIPLRLLMLAMEFRRPVEPAPGLVIHH